MRQLRDERWPPNKTLKSFIYLFLKRERWVPVLILRTTVRLTNLFIHRYGTNGCKTRQDCVVNYEAANRAYTAATLSFPFITARAGWLMARQEQHRTRNRPHSSSPLDTDAVTHNSTCSYTHRTIHTPSIAFRHLPPNSARFGYATEGALDFISAQLSSDAVRPSERFGY